MQNIFRTVKSVRFYILDYQEQLAQTVPLKKKIPDKLRNP